jgi:hypothetical protein
LGSPNANTTVYAEDNSLVTAGALTSHLFLTLNPGAWELEIEACYSSNYPSTNNGLDLQVNIAGITAFNLVRLFSAQTAGGTVDHVRDLVLALDTVTTFTAILNANTAGQTHGAHVGILASLLI